ncbi:MAG TPA: hypothetical protein DDW43_02120 [Nitrosomonas sp.]|nr:hypothetical protein [Nitrosomonas sp. PRO5]HBF24295.1 hypothetical protein [Nitrosomonas sp.]
MQIVSMNYSPWIRNFRKPRRWNGCCNSTGSVRNIAFPLSSIRDNDYQMKPVILRQDIQQTEIALALTEPSAHPIVKLVPDF